MARLFATGINLNKNELQNARIQNLSANPQNGVAGQIYFNTTDNELRYYDGSNWISGSSVEFGNTTSRPAASKAGQLYVDTEAKVIYVDNGTSWVQGTLNESDVNNLIDTAITNGETNAVFDTVHATRNSDAENFKVGDDAWIGDIDVPNTINIKGVEDATKGYISFGNNWGDGEANTLIGFDGSDLHIRNNTNNIILHPDGAAYIGNNSSDNRIATIGDLAADGVASVSGTTGEISASTDGSGNVTLSLPNIVNVHSGLDVGSDAENETNQDGYINIWKADGSKSLIADNEGLTVNGGLELQDGSGNAKLNVTYSGTGATRITSNDDIAIRSQSGDIILYPGSNNQWGGDGGYGKAYVNWGNDATGAGPENEITTAGNVQSITNKTVNDELYFTNPSTIPSDGGIVVNDSNEHFEIRAYTADLDLYANNGNITLNPNNKAFYGSAATAGNEIARLSDIQALSSGLNWKQAVNLLYDDSNPTLSGDSLTSALVIDGHAALSIANNGYRILVSQGNDAGIYIYSEDPATSEWTLTRTEDADVYSELIGAAVFVMEGTQYGSTSWVQSNHYITNFTDQDWIQFSGQGTYIGSNSIQIDGNQIGVIANTGSGITVTLDGVEAKINTSNGLQFNQSGEIEVKLGDGLSFDGSGNVTFDTGYGVRKYTTTIGDNSATSFTVHHAFGTRHVTVQIFEAATPYAQVEADVEHTDTSNVTVKFASAPTTGQYEVVIVG